jgi:hypothetical protein
MLPVPAGGDAVSGRPPPLTKSHWPWYRTSWGTVYLTLLGIAAATILLIALAVPQRSGAGRELALLISAGILDVLLPMPIAIGVFRRRFWRLPSVPAADLVLSLILLAPCIYVVWTLVFMVWFSLATIF